jgi:AsmA protein
MLKRRRTEQDELLVRPDSPAQPAPPRPVQPRQEAPRPAPPPPPPIAATEPDPEDEPDDFDEPPPQQRRRRRARPLRSLAILAGIAVAIYLILPLLLRAERMRPLVEQALGQALGRTVRIGSLKFTVGFGALVASDVTVSEDPAFGSNLFAHARQVTLDVDRFALIFGSQVEISSVELTEASLTFIRNTSRKWNFYSFLTGGAPPADGGPKVRLRHGILTFRTTEGVDPVTLRDVSADFPHLTTNAEVKFTFSSAVDGGGTLKLNGRAGPVVWNRGFAGLPMNVLVNAKKVAMAQSNLTTGIAAALDGALNLDGTMESDGNIVTIGGNAQVTDLKLARMAAPAHEPLLVVFTVHHDLSAESGAITRGEIHLGKGSAQLTGRYSTADARVSVSLQLEAHGAPAPPLGALLTAAAIPLPSGASLAAGLTFLDIKIDGPLDRPLINGTVTVNNTKLVNFDLEDRLASVSGLDALHFGRDLLINMLTAKVSSGPDRLNVVSLEMELPEIGALSGSGSIRDDATLDLQMTAVRNGIADKRPIPFTVRGACVGPIFRQPGKI